MELGKETLRLEAEFSKAVGFDEADDDLPAFFYQEPLPPSNKAARFHGDDVHSIYEKLG
jgi:aldehyde:ferredoxin oxidoreductase